MKVRVMSRTQFKSWLPNRQNEAVISILDEGDLPIVEDALTLHFVDWEKEEHNFILFNSNMAKQIVEYVELNKNKDFVIHCTMGKSRSAAVGSVLADYFNIPYLEYLRYSPQATSPNLLVKKLLSYEFSKH